MESIKALLFRNIVIKKTKIAIKITDYDKNNMNKKLDPSKFGVLIVDMQSLFLNYIGEEAKLDLIKRQIRLLELCKKKDYPVAVLEFKNTGNTIQEIIGPLSKIPRYSFFEKSNDDGFMENPRLKHTLKNWGLEDLCISGVNAECCVLQTAIGASKNGFRIISSKKLIASSSGNEGINYLREWFQKERKYYSYLKYGSLMAQLE